MNRQPLPASRLDMTRPSSCRRTGSQSEADNDKLLIKLRTQRQLRAPAQYPQKAGQFRQGLLWLPHNVNHRHPKYGYSGGSRTTLPDAGSVPITRVNGRDGDLSARTGRRLRADAPALLTDQASPDLRCHGSTCQVHIASADAHIALSRWSVHLNLIPAGVASQAHCHIFGSAGTPLLSATSNNKARQAVQYR